MRCPACGHELEKARQAQWERTVPYRYDGPIAEVITFTVWYCNGCSRVWSEDALTFLAEHFEGNKRRTLNAIKKRRIDYG